MTTDTVCCTQRGHSHTDGAAQDHGLLTHHRLRLIPHTWLALWRILLRILRLLFVLRLAIGLWVLGLLSVRLLAICCLIWLLLRRVLSRRWHIARLCCLYWCCWHTELIAATGTEAQARSVFLPTVSTEGTHWCSTRCLQVLPTVATESVAGWYFCLAGGTVTG